MNGAAFAASDTIEMSDGAEGGDEGVQEEQIRIAESSRKGSRAPMERLSRSAHTEA